MLLYIIWSKTKDKAIYACVEIGVNLKELKT